MGKILELSSDNEEKEMEFELNYLKSLATKHRLEMMMSRGNEIKRMLIKNGHRKPFEIIKRK